MSKTFSIKTLGCKLNQYETSQIAAQFLDNGWRALPFGERVDLVIINTCTVTDRSDKKCRKYIRQGAALSRAGKAIVTGCLVERDPVTLRSMPEVMEVFTNREKDSIYTRITRSSEPERLAYTRGDTVNRDLVKVRNTHPLPGSPVDGNPSTKAMRRGYGTSLHVDADERSAETPLPYFHTRGYVKVQDGCDGMCSYCIIPSVRGKPRSRPFREILDHARRLIDHGCPELILTGITIGKYNCNGKTLSELVESLINIRGRFRVRITSIEPDHISASLLSLFTSEKICNHVHLPLQSGSDRILRRMRRPYTRAEYMNTIEDIRAVVPDMAIGTDLIVGFPGEVEDDFKQTVEMVEMVKFSYVHQFTFSPRSGTDAASMVQDLSPRTIAERSDRLRELSKRIGLEYRKKFEGRILESVIEKKRFRDNYTAVTDNYIKIALDDSVQNGEGGRLAPVKLISAGIERNRGIIIH
jgi:threonylcarbamoyladenosine tRNA methylthiotransferase MtaB